MHYLVLTKEAYLPNDIITKLESFLVSIYGRKNLKNNLLFLARGLKKKGNPKKILRNYFLNTFYKDQSKRYYKHPLYWMIDSGKQDGCKILFYYFEYTKETLDTLKTKAVIPLLQKYKHRILEKENKLQRAEKRDGYTLKKAQMRLKKQEQETEELLEKMMLISKQKISFSFRDSSEDNYAYLQKILAKHY